MKRSVATVLLFTALALLGPPPQDAGLAATNADRGGCSRVSIGGAPPTVSGGCGLTATPARTRFSVLTLGGAVPFEDCDMQFTIRLDDDGRLGVEEMGMSDIVPEGACGDIVPCRWEGGERDRLYDLRELAPWSGQARSNGREAYALAIDVCLNTCMGRFEGRLDMRLRRTERGWRATARRAAVGTSGLRIDGAWTVAWEPGSARPSLPD